MLLRRLAPLAAALALTAPIASGCGAEDAAGVDVADAAAATAKKGTASYTMRISMSGGGIPSKAELRATGVTSLTKPQLTVSTDLGPLLSGFGVPVPSAPIDLRVDGGTVYVKPPAFPGIEIPGGKEWVSLDLAKIVGSFGVDAQGLAGLMTVDPVSTLRLVDTAKGLREVGKETINGTETTHWRGTYSIRESIDALPADQRDAARKALRQLEDKLGGAAIADTTPVDLWIDKDGVLRRMSVAQSIPAAKGSPAGRFAVIYDLTKFGADLDVGRPASVYDATQPLIDALENLDELLPPGTLG